MISRSEIDQSHVELDLRMTEGDPIRLNFLVLDAASWNGVAFTCLVKQRPGESEDVLADIDVIATGEGDDLDVLLTHAPVAALTAVDSPYAWGMKEDTGVTRFGGMFYVEPRVV
jgi:hypothetical protein